MSAKLIVVKLSPDIPAVPPRSADCGIALMLSQAHRTIIALTGVLAGRAECLSRLREKHGFISFKLLKSGLQSFAESNANIKTSLFRFDISALAVARCNAREAPSNAKSTLRTPTLTIEPQLVEPRRIELLTPCVQGRCSPS